MTPPRYLSEDMVYALRLARRGETRARIIEAISRRHPKYGYHSRVFGELVATRGFAVAGRYAERTTDKALAEVKRSPRVMDPHEAVVRLSTIFASACAETWPITLAGPRRALEAAFLLGFQRRRVIDLGLDVRTHAMRAGQSFSSVVRHREKLHELGWLRRNPEDRGPRTSRFTFYAPGTSNTPSGAFNVQDPIILGHDAWRRKGLGEEAWLVYRMVEIGIEPPDGDSAALNRLAKAGLLDTICDAERTLRCLDLAALDAQTFNTGYEQGMTFLLDRERREEVIRCAQLGGRAS